MVCQKREREMLDFLYNRVIFYLDKFQGLIQMKDATTAQSAKLVINLFI